MKRKLAGIVTLTMAVLSILVMSALVAPPRPGVAIRTAIPEPPEIGSCGNLYGWELVIVNCAQTHTVEVAYTWTAAAPAAGPQPTFGLCADKVRNYVGSPPAQDADAHEPGSWTRPLRYRQVVATGPDGNNLRDWSWQACLVAPIGPAPSSGYQGQVRQLPPEGPSSPYLRSCYVDPGTALQVVPCTSPHIGEVIATQLVSNPSSSDPADPTMDSGSVKSCAAEAQLVTGSDDPTYQGVLRAIVLSDQLTNMPFGADIGVFYTAESSNWLVCTLESATGRRLLNSVAGVGNGELPLE